LWSTLLFIAFAPAAATAQLVEDRPLSLYGTPGMIDMPSARFMPDGAFAFTAATKRPDDRLSMTFQALPWLEVTGRYAIVYGYFRATPAQRDLFDRSIGFKIRLSRENWMWPEIAIGALDIGGTQLYGGEYLVGSKKFGPVDASLGLGFGRFGTQAQFTNPLALLSDRFRTRPPPTTAGGVQIGNLFRGEDASLFGGVVIDTPVRGLQLVAEYSGDKYAAEQTSGIAAVHTPLNVGVSYRPARFVELSADWLQGYVLAFRLSLRTNLKEPRVAYKLDPPAPDIHVRSDEEMRRGLTNLLSSTGTRVFAAGSERAGARVNFVELANAPDWTIYPIAFAEQPPDQERGIGGMKERLDSALAPLKFKVAGAATDAGALVIDLTPTAARAPLQCDEVWREIPGDLLRDLSGFQTLTFRNLAPDRQNARCTKFLDGAALAGATPIPIAATPVSSLPQPHGNGWWEDKKYSNEVANAVATILKRQGLSMEAVHLEPHEAVIYFNNATYPSQGRAFGRAARAMTQVLPPSIDIITLVLTTGSLNGTRITIPRAAMERAAKSQGSPEEILAASQVAPALPGLPAGPYKPVRRFPSFHPIFAPSYRHSLFDPDDPLRYQIYWRVGADIDLFRGLKLTGVYALNIYNDFASITRGADSVLPHVRSDVAQYLKHDATGLRELEAVWLHQLSPELFVRLSSGYLEEMYGGIDAELLYRPFARRWAMGAEIAEVRKRAFDGGFGFQHFRATTGHVSLYYESPYYGLNFNVHAGRYLAGDWGATFEIGRRFDNGAEISAFATFTDVPFHKFGEGSFDKGIVIKFPLDFVSFFSTRQMADLTLKPLTRDGGARLDIDHRLYEETRPVSYGDVERNWRDFLAPR
jgi:hypothetical protein